MSRRRRSSFEQNFVAGVRVERRVEIDEIDRRVREMLAVAQDVQIVAVVELVHRASMEERARFDKPARPFERVRKRAFLHAPFLPSRAFGRMGGIGGFQALIGCDFRDPPL